MAEISISNKDWQCTGTRKLARLVNEPAEFSPSYITAHYWFHCYEDHCCKIAIKVLKMTCLHSHDLCCAAGADGNTYEKITGEAETLDILTFVKEHMENGSVILLRIFFARGDAAKSWLLANFTS